VFTFDVGFDADYSTVRERGQTEVLTLPSFANFERLLSGVPQHISG
jgi:hypothetical protein